MKYYSGKEIAVLIRNFVKKEFPQEKFSVTVDRAGFTDSIRIVLMASPVPPCVSDHVDKDNFDVNHYYISRNNYLTPEAKAMFSKINNFILSYHYDKSDSQIDYFETNFYYHLAVGRWDKPFTLCRPRPMAKTTTRLSAALQT
jgi:hypothetical protein